MGGGGKSGGGSVDRTQELYAQQQADLSAERARLEEEDRVAREDEQRRRDELRRQQLGSRDILSEDDNAVVAQNVLG